MFAFIFSMIVDIARDKIDTPFTLKRLQTDDSCDENDPLYSADLELSCRYQNRKSFTCSTFMEFRTIFDSNISGPMN